jgi:two-component system sensor histidine kinase BaeS
VRVQYKLFAITLFASFVLVASMLALAQWSFDRGLLEHVNKRALQQYTRLSEQLVSHYQDKGDWQALSESRYAWLQLQADAGIDIDSRELQRARRDSMRRRANEHPPRREHRPPGGDRLPPPGKNPKPERFALLDEDKQLLAGDLVKPEHRQYLEIIQAGQVIGYVVYADRERLLDDYELDLSSQLSSNLWWVAGLMILLSASLALPFSKLLLSPLRPIVESIHALAKGDFSRRIEVANQDEIGRVAKDINHLAQQLEAVDTSRKTWLANISHELRTPLAVMRGELEAMLDGIREINKDNLSSAHQEALHLQRLVEDLYQLTSSELGDDNVAQMSYQKQELDFSALVEDDLERFQPLIDKAGLNFSFINNAQAGNKEAWVRGDSSRLSQLIHNLVNNSIKYTQAPGTLMAELTVKNDVIVFTLKDSAPSVKEGELEKIFDHLYRAEQSRNRKTGGSGLGLAICKKIAQSHEGELTASLSDLGGIKMTLCLPLS